MVDSPSFRRRAITADGHIREGCRTSATVVKTAAKIVCVAADGDPCHCEYRTHTVIGNSTSAVGGRVAADRSIRQRGVTYVIHTTSPLGSGVAGEDNVGESRGPLIVNSTAVGTAVSTHGAVGQSKG